MSNYAIMIGGKHFPKCNSLTDEELLERGYEFLGTNITKISL